MSREIISPEAGEVSGTQLPMDGSTHAQLWRIAFLPWELLASGKLENSWRASLKVYGLTYSRFTHRGCMVHSFFFFFQLIKTTKKTKKKTLRYTIGMLSQSPVKTSSLDHANGLAALSCVCGSTTIL